MESPNHDEIMFDSTCNIRKGQIWHIAQKETTTTGCEMWSNRPALIVSNDVHNSKAGFVLVVYLTTQKKRDLPYHVKIWSGDRNAIALCEQIHTVDKSRIEFYIGSITDEEMKDVDRALLFSLGISNTLKPSTLFKKWANAVNRYDIDLAENPNETESEIESKTENNEICFNNKSYENINIKETPLSSIYKYLYDYEKDARQKTEYALSMCVKLCENNATQSSKSISLQKENENKNFE